MDNPHRSVGNINFPFFFAPDMVLMPLLLLLSDYPLVRLVLFRFLFPSSLGFPVAESPNVSDQNVSVRSKCTRFSCWDKHRTRFLQCMQIHAKRVFPCLGVAKNVIFIACTYPRASDHPASRVEPSVFFAFFSISRLFVRCCSIVMGVEK